MTPQLVDDNVQAMPVSLTLHSCNQPQRDDDQADHGTSPKAAEQDQTGQAERGLWGNGSRGGWMRDVACGGTRLERLDARCGLWGNGSRGSGLKM